MEITEIVVTAGRTFNHPHESYSNLRPEVTLKAMLHDGDDPALCARQLQAQAEGLVEDHKQNMLASIERLAEMGSLNRELSSLDHQITSAQQRMESLRNRHKELTAPESMDALP